MPGDEDISENLGNEQAEEELSQAGRGGKVIMNMDPNKFNKKDHIFMDFFSMYGKNFIKSKK